MGHCLFLRKGETHTAQLGLPSGYERLVYIQSSGTQHIDTGVQLSTNLSAEIDFQAVATTNDTWFFSVLNVASLVGWRAGFVHGAFYLVDFTASQASSPTSRTIFSGQSTKSYALNIYLFAENRDGSAYGKCSGKMYRCKIYDNGIKVRDFVPCINASGEVGLYDLVGKQFYGNAGTGIFTGSEVA